MKKEYDIQREVIRSDLDDFAMANHMQANTLHWTDTTNGFSEDLKFIAQNNERTLFVRCHMGKDEEKLAQQIEFMKFLKACGFPVPTLIGENPLFKGAIGIYVAYEHIEGRVSSDPNGLSSHDLRTAGQLLGQLHLFSREFGRIDNIPLGTHLDTDHQLVIVGQVERILGSKDVFDEVDRLVSGMLPKKKEELLHVAANPSENRRAALLPQIMIHGDYHGANLIFDDVAIKAVIDWEDSTFWSRAAEVQASIAMNCKTQPTEHFNVPIDLIRAREFLDAYEEVYPLSAEEKILMADMSRLDALRLDFLLGNHYLKGRRMDELMPSDPSYWFWWKNNIDQYREIVLRI